MRSVKMRKVSRRGVAAGRAKGKSLCARLAPSSGAQGSNGIQRRKGRPRMDKQEREFRLRGTGNRVKERRWDDAVCGNRHWSRASYAWQDAWPDAGTNPFRG